jgi:hypothetical protein
VFPIILGEIKLNKNIFLHKTTEQLTESKIGFHFPHAFKKELVLHCTMEVADVKMKLTVALVYIRPCIQKYTV